MTTITTLQLKTTFFELMGELYSGTATGGGASGVSITDDTQAIGGLRGYVSDTWPTKIVGTQLRVTSGSASGNLRMVGKFDPSDGILYPHQSMTAAVAANDTYELWGTAINGGLPLTALFNMVMRACKPVTDTQVTEVTLQLHYDISTVVQTKRDIRSVYIRFLDPANLAPYRIGELSPGRDWTAHDRGGAGTPTVTLELKNPRTLNTAIETLWVRGATTFAPLADDTSTVDAVYRDWLAWEAVNELCRRKLSLTTGDQARWKALGDRAREELSTWRDRFIPREPVEIGLDY